MNNRKVKSKNLLIVFIMLVCCLFTPFSSSYLVASAETTNYSNVLEDLRQDKSFDYEDYPVVSENNSLQVIQIAESIDGELLVYVYNPSANRLATSISISTGINDNFYPELYTLTLLSKERTLSKYVVNNFQVKQDVVRYYDITSIFRKWDKNIDASAEGDNTISEVSYEVGKLFTACTVNNQVTYSWNDVETIEITDKFVGFVKYTDGFHLLPNSKAIDSHFVAFSTSRTIDKLIEADVYYTSQYVHYMYYIGDYQYSFGDIKENTVTLSAEKEEHFTGGGLFAPVYKWKEIQSINEFFETENSETIYECGLFNVRQRTKLTEQGKKNLQDKQWVLRFANTNYSHSSTGSNSGSYTIIADVSILRLKFETDGKVYNLGVVDNKQTGSSNPSNETSVSVSISWWVWLIVGIVAFILLLVLAITFFPNLIIKLFEIIFWLIGKVFKGMWWLIKLPFKLVKKE